MLCSFYFFKEQCLSSRSDRLLSFMLIYHLWPLPIKALPVHELVVWDMQYSTEYSKKKTKKKREKLTGDSCVLIFY